MPVPKQSRSRGIMSEEYIDLSKTKFTLGLPIHSPQIPVYTAFSLLNTVRAFDAAQVALDYVVELQCSIVDSARNNVVKMFLDNPEHQKLICIDSDIVWEAEDLLRLCCWSTKYPVIAGMYCSKSETDPKFLGDYWKDPEINQVMQNEYGLIKMTGIGLGFCVIDRSVFETMIPETRQYNDSRNGLTYRFFSTTDDDTGDFVGEDIYFLRRWTKKFGGELWVDPTVNLGHVGTKVYKGDLFKSLVEFNEKLKAVQEVTSSSQN